MPRPNSIVIAFTVIMMAIIGVPPSMAQEILVPVKLHVVLLKKVFSLSKTLQGKKITVVIVYTDASSRVKDEVLSGFKAIGIQATACLVSQMEQEAGDADVIYIAPGANAAQKFCEENGILSITGMPSLTESGRTSVSIGIVAGKPKVLVNTRRAKIEKQEFSAGLLKVAKIYQ